MQHVHTSARFARQKFSTQSFSWSHNWCTLRSHALLFFLLLLSIKFLCSVINFKTWPRSSLLTYPEKKAETRLETCTQHTRRLRCRPKWNSRFRVGDLSSAPLTKKERQAQANFSTLCETFCPLALADSTSKRVAHTDRSLNVNGMLIIALRCGKKTSERFRPTGSLSQNQSLLIKWLESPPAVRAINIFNYVCSLVQRVRKCFAVCVCVYMITGRWVGGGDVDLKKPSWLLVPSSQPERLNDASLSDLSALSLTRNHQPASEKKNFNCGFLMHIIRQRQPTGRVST